MKTRLGWCGKSITYKIVEKGNLIIANISFSVTWKDLVLLTVLYEKDSKQLALSIGLHIEAKKLLKMFAFLQKSETNLPLTKRGGIVRGFLS